MPLMTNRRSAPRRLAGLVMVAALALLAVTTSASAAEIDFDGPPAVVGQAPGVAYATSPGVLFSPPGVLVPGPGGGQEPCGGVVEATPLAASGPNAFVFRGGQSNQSACGGGEFPLQLQTLFTFTTQTYQQVAMTVASPEARTVQMVGFDPDGDISAQTAQVTLTPGVTRRLTMSTGDAGIATVVLKTVSTTLGGSVAVDDIDLPDPPVAGPPAFLLTRLQSTDLVVNQGEQGSTEVALFRLNGSNGAVDYSFSGPPGVTFSSRPSVNGRIVDVLVATNAPAQALAPVTVTARPANAGAGTAASSVTFGLTIVPAIRISTNGLRSLRAPTCDPLRLGYSVRPSVGASRWRLNGLPAGVSAQIDGVDIASAPVITDGAFHEVTLTLGATTTFTPRDVDLEIVDQLNRFSGALGLAVQGLTFNAAADPTVTRPPEAMQPGTTVTLRARDLCVPAGAKARVGNDKAVTDIQRGPEADTLRIEVPPLATTGTIDLLPDPANPAFKVPGPRITVRGFRETTGFGFKNDQPTLTWKNMEDAYGDKATHITVDACTVFGDCEIVTPIPDPFALVLLGIAKVTIGGEHGGVCYGITRTGLQFRNGIRSRAGFSPAGAADNFQLDRPGAAQGRLVDVINPNQLFVLSREMLANFLAQSLQNDNTESLNLRLRIERALRSGRYPGILMRGSGVFEDLLSLHVVTAYNVTDASDDPGDFYVWVYDSNMPFAQGQPFRDTPAGMTNLPNELNPNGVDHETRTLASRIRIRPDGRFQMPSTGSMQAGADSLGNIVILDDPTTPAQPRLPTAGDVASDTFTLLTGIGSAVDGTAGPVDTGWTVSQVESGGKRLYDDEGGLNGDRRTRLAGAPWVPPVGDDTDIGGVVVDASGPIRVSADGNGGAASQVVVGPGFVGSVRTSSVKGATDEVTAGPGGLIGVDPAGSGARAATASVMVAGAGGARLAAEVTTRAGATGLKVALAPSGQLTVSGASGAVRLTLSRLAKDGSATLTATTVAGRTGRVTIPAASFRGLRSGKIRFTAGGRTRVVRGRIARGTVGVRVTSATPRGRTIAVKTRIRTRPTGATQVTVSLKRGGRTLATKTRTLPGGATTATLSWSLRRPSGAGVRVVASASRIDLAGGVPVLATGTAQKRLPKP